MVSFNKIFKQAYEITRQYKFLWLFGLFLVLLDLVGFLIGSLNNETINSIPVFWKVLAAIVLMILTLIRYRAKAAIIITAKAVVDKQEVSYYKSFGTARFFYWQVFGVSLLLEMAAGIILILAMSPILSLYEKGSAGTAVSLGIFGAGILIPLLAAIALINILAPMFIVLFDQKIGEAVEKSQRLFTKHWSILLALSLLMFFLQMGALFLAAFVVKLASGTLVLGLIAGSIIYLVFCSLVSVYTQICWVLVFLEIVKPQKFEGEQPVVAPEIVS